MEEVRNEGGEGGCEEETKRKGNEIERNCEKTKRKYEKQNKEREEKRGEKGDGDLINARCEGQERR